MENEKNQKPFDEEAKREAENTQQNSSEEGKKMEIEITRYKAIVRAFNEPKKLAKLIIVIALIITLVFLGVTLIALVVKSYYPYKTVNSNEYGATVIQNEDNEVIYWLFNSADLWANSGIEVKEGDVISVRTSGAAHSAIHRLVRAAESNSIMQDRWLSPIGGDFSQRNWDTERAKYRISETADFNSILMQVIPKNVKIRNKYGELDTAYSYYLDGRKGDIYEIGSGRESITIREDGILHFAVNDIVLTQDVVNSMKQHNTGNTMDLAIRYDIKDCSRSLRKLVNALSESLKKDDCQQMNSLLSSLNNLDSCIADLDSINKQGYKPKIRKWNKQDPGYVDSLLKTYKSYIDSIDDNIAIIKNDSLSKDCIISQSIKTELEEYQKVLRRIKKNNPDKTPWEIDYYIENAFVDAWFVDNVGSFLIVIERKKQ